MFWYMVVGDTVDSLSKIEEITTQVLYQVKIAVYCIAASKSDKF